MEHQQFDEVETGAGRLHVSKAPPSPVLDDDGHGPRTGTVWTAAAHVITAVIGSGVLSLAWSMAQLGWVMGPIVMLGFSLVTYYFSVMLADAYRSPDPVTGKRNYTYKDAVKANLEHGRYLACATVQYINLVGTGVGYTLTASISMAAIERSNCFHKHGRHDPCHVSNNLYMVIFGVLQIIFSQIPDLHKMWWLSIVAAVMSFSYSTIGLSLAIGKSTEHNRVPATLKGAALSGLFSNVDKTWNVFRALGNVAFAYSFSMILIEIQDTIKCPPAENKTMKKATLIGVVITTLFYSSVGFIGYAAFGVHAPGNLLTGFGFYNPFWLVDIANLCIIIHLVGAYQVFVQPVFGLIEGYCMSKWPKSNFINKKFSLPGVVKPTAFCLVWRTCFVIFTTIVAMIFPFFNDVMGILGSLAFFPLTVYFPTEMHILQKKIPSWSLKWVLLKIISIICFIISLVAMVGSVASVVVDLRANYTPFKTRY